MDDHDSDSFLLERFRESRDEAAFRQLVDRYLGMVLGVALRRTGDRGGAEEIAQNTFAVLAKRANTLARDRVLSGWLHRVATIEAAEFNRREYRRRRAMNELKLNEVSDANNEVTAFSEYLPFLDEALEKLTHTDRDALMLRFHLGMRYGEMAERLGKSEEAARKQVSRALGKLAARLGKRAPITAATLAAGLPLALTKTAPAAMVSTVSSSALASVTSSSAFTFKLLYLMKTQAGIIAALGILLCTGSFLIGRHSAASFETAVIEQAARHTQQRQQAVEVTRQLEAQEAEKPRRTVPQILNDAIAAYGEHSSAGYYRARLVLEELDPRDYATALTHLESHHREEEVFEKVGALLAGLLGNTDGPAAMTWVEENLDSKTTTAYGHVLESWSTYDPTSAYAWYQEKAESGQVRRFFRSLSRSVFKGWAERDPTEAIAALEHVTIEEERGALGGIAQAVQHSPNPALILDAIAEMSPQAVRGKLVEEVAKTWAREEVHSAAAWLDTIPTMSSKDLFKAKAEVAEEWMRLQPGSMLEIGAWMLAGAPSDLRADIQQAIADAMAETEKENK